MLNYRILSLLLALTITHAPSMQRQAPQPAVSSWEAARKGDINTLQNLLERHPDWVNGRDKGGLTPLAWAAIGNHFDMVKWLVDVKHADVNSKDNKGEPILHKVARGGNHQLIFYLLNHDAKKDINATTQEKGRTALAEALRASKNAIIHLDIETKDFSTPQELGNAIPSALNELVNKESHKLSTDQMIPIINLLSTYGATPNPADATNRTLDYYINNVELVSEPERINLLRAVGAPRESEKPRVIQYSETNLPFAIQMLEKLAGGLEQFGLKPKIMNTIWTIQVAQRESNRMRKSNILRVAMALLSNVKEEIKKRMPDRFAAFEPHLDIIRTILRDTILILSGKITAPSVPIQPAPTPSAIPIPSKGPVSAITPTAPIGRELPQPRALPVPTARPPVSAPITARPSTAVPAQATASETTHLLRNIINQSGKRVSYAGNLDGQPVKGFLNAGGIGEFNKLIDNGLLVFTGYGIIRFSRKEISIDPRRGKGHMTSQEEFFDIVIHPDNNDTSLTVQPAS